ncbi:MAG: helix-turn-helix transcriptional regulator [Actinocatenispora sp.]
MATPLRRRRLAAILKKHREQAHMTTEQVEAACGVGKSTVSRIETASIRIKPLYVKALCDAYGIDGEDRAAFMQLSRDAERTGWWSPYAGTLSGQYLEYISFEASAKALRTYEPLVVPGLLQTAEYARAVIAGMVRPTLRDSELEERVKVRIERQGRLDGVDALSLWAIVDESALRRPTGGPDVMRAQLQHLYEVSRLPNVTLQVVGNELGAHPGMTGSFFILSFPSKREEDVIYLDTPIGDLYAEAEQDIESCTMLFEHLRAAALNEDQSRQRIRDAERELRQ